MGEQRENEAKVEPDAAEIEDLEVERTDAEDVTGGATLRPLSPPEPSGVDGQHNENLLRS